LGKLATLIVNDGDFFGQDVQDAQDE